jgi:hypothetical protein
MNSHYDLRRGKWRFWGHLGIFFAVPQLVAVVSQELGVSLRYFLALPWLLIPSGILLIYVYEQQDYRKNRNGRGKGILDFISKSLGWTLGVGTWLVWWI